MPIPVNEKNVTTLSYALIAVRNSFLQYEYTLDDLALEYYRADPVMALSS